MRSPMWARGFASVFLTAGFVLGTTTASQPSLPQNTKTGQPATADKLPADVRNYVEKHLLDPEMEWDETLRGLWFDWDAFDLNGDGKREYFIASYCSPTGNCQLDVLERRPKGLRSLLNTDLVSIVCVRTPKSRGYRDLELRSHGGAFQQGVTVFRFDGDTYEQAESYSLRWEYDDQTGKSVQVEGPKTSDCHELFPRQANKPPQVK